MYEFFSLTSFFLEKKIDDDAFFRQEALSSATTAHFFANTHRRRPFSPRVETRKIGRAIVPGNKLPG